MQHLTTHESHFLNDLGATLDKGLGTKSSRTNLNEIEP
jgi:hypothetical protein